MARKENGSYGLKYLIEAGGLGAELDKLRPLDPDSTFILPIPPQSYTSVW